MNEETGDTPPAALLLGQTQATFLGVTPRRYAEWERGRPGRFIPAAFPARPRAALLTPDS